MEEEPVAADLNALDALLTQADGAAPAMAALVAELREQRHRLARLPLPSFVAWTAMDRFEDLLGVWGENVRFVADVADALRVAGWPVGDGWLETASSVPSRLLAATTDERLDDFEAGLAAGGMPADEAAALRAEVAKRLARDHTLRFADAVLDGTAAYQGVARAEVEQAGRAFRLTRADVVRIIGHHFDLVAGLSGRDDQITVEDLIATVDDGEAPLVLRDAAYRLAADSNLFNAIEVARQTDLTAMPLRGFHLDRGDGIVSRDDLKAFPVVEFNHRVMATWLPLLDTADEGYDLSRADGRVGERAVATFIADLDIPFHVRAVVYDVYRFTHKLSDPRALPRRGADEPGFGATDGAWAVVARTAPRIITSTPTAAETATGGVLGMATALAVASVVGAVIGWRVARPVSLARETDSAVRYVNPVTGQITTFDLDQLAGLTPSQRKGWVAYVAAYGEPPPDLATAAGPVPWLDPAGHWRWSDTGDPINDLVVTAGGKPVPHRRNPTPPGTRPDVNGDDRYIYDNELHDGYLLSPTERRRYYRPPEGLAADTLEEFVIDGVTYQRHQVTFHPLCDDAGVHVHHRGQPLYTVEPLGSSGIEINGSKSLIRQKDTGWWHLDLENPPGHLGQIHLQYKDSNGRQQRHIYDFNTDTFLPNANGDSLSARQLKEITSHPQYERELNRARGWLGVGVTGEESE